ncbi:MAG: hypothetical protein RLY40_1202 [Pseudomonadota bacterium]|jgi:hypothetical protein
MPEDNLNRNPGLVAKLRAEIDERTKLRQRQAAAAYNALVGAPGSSHRKTISVNQTQAQQSANLSQAEQVPDYVEYFTVDRTDKGKAKRILSPQEFQTIKSNIHQQKFEEANAESVLNQQKSESLIYADLLFDPTSETVIGKPSDELTKYSQIFGQGSKEIVKSQIAILRDQKKEFLEKLNQAIDENEKKSIDAYCSQLSAIETSMATKINYLEKQASLHLEQDKSLSDTIQDEEVDWATVTVAADGTRSITFEDQKEKPVNLEKQQKLTTTGPAVDWSNKPKIDSSKKSEDSLVEQRQPTGDKNNRVQFTESTIERYDLKEQQKKELSESKQDFKAANPTSTEGPPVDRSVKPGPAVKCELKPSRLAKVNFFSMPTPGSSLSADQDEKEKEKIDKKRFA